MNKLDFERMQHKIDMIENSNQIINRVPDEYKPLEIWYQNQRMKRSKIYFDTWPCNFGPCFYDAMIYYKLQNFIKKIWNIT